MIYVCCTSCLLITLMHTTLVNNWKVSLNIAIMAYRPTCMWGPFYHFQRMQAYFITKKNPKNVIQIVIFRALFALRMHHLMFIFQIFSGGACPQTPLVWLRAFGASHSTLGTCPQPISTLVTPLDWPLTSLTLIEIIHMGSNVRCCSLYTCDHFQSTCTCICWRREWYTKCLISVLLVQESLQTIIVI